MRYLLLTVITLLTACANPHAPAPQQATLDGTAAYRERIALLPGSVLAVTLEDTSLADAPATVLGEYRAAVTTQVPLPFSVSYNPADVQAGHRYSLRAKLLSADGQLLFTSDTRIPVLGAGDPRSGIRIPLVAVRRPPASEQASVRTLFFECPDVDFMVRTGPGELALWLGDDYTVLSQVPAASGHQYAEGELRVWMKGEEAMLEAPGIKARGCRNNPQRAVWEDAKRRGVDFRATGNEPGWVLEIDHEQGMSLLLENGHTRIRTAMPAAEKSGHQTRYTAQANDHRLAVTLEHKRCTDTMADIMYTTTVTVQADGETLHGCGNALQ